LHGHIDFTTVHDRKTRDRIADNDWRSLIGRSPKFENVAPTTNILRTTTNLACRHSHAKKPINEATSTKDKSVEERCRILLLKLEFSQQTLKEFESESP
jgi:hypothetical protein